MPCLAHVVNHFQNHFRFFHRYFAYHITVGIQPDVLFDLAAPHLLLGLVWLIPRLKFPVVSIPLSFLLVSLTHFNTTQSLAREKNLPPLTCRFRDFVSRNRETGHSPVYV